jgi:hypothetical protein
MELLQFLIIILALISVWSSLREPPLMTTVRRKYDILTRELRKTGEFPSLHRETIITGLLSKGEIGYNVNKGYEIFICLDGTDENQVMHVLLHELAHITVSEFQHSGGFWDNLHKLKAVAGRMGLYRGISRAPYCGHFISD